MKRAGLHTPSFFAIDGAGRVCIHCWLTPDEHPQDPAKAMVLYDEDFAGEQLESLMRTPHQSLALPLNTRVTYLGAKPPELTCKRGVVVGTNTQLGAGSMKRMLTVKFDDYLGIHHLPQQLFMTMDAFSNKK